MQKSECFQVFLSLGSNVQRTKNIQSCLADLRQQFDVLQCSKVYESESVGFDGENFYNLVVEITTALSVGVLLSQLRDVENRHGRDRSAPKFSARTLDIDILTYGSVVGVVDDVQLPRDEILTNAFVLWPLSEIAPEGRHPVCGDSYRELWQKYDKTQQKIWQTCLE